MGSSMHGLPVVGRAWGRLTGSQVASRPDGGRRDRRERERTGRRSSERRGGSMRTTSRAGFLTVGIFTVLMLTATAAWAGSAHFVDGTVTKTVSGNTLTVSGKEAG